MVRAFARHVAVIGLGLLLFFLQGPSFVRHLATQLPEGGDAVLNAWIMAWDVHALTQPGADVWNAPIYFPARNTLAFSETLFGNLWIALPVDLLTHNPILVANLVILSAFVLTMYTTFLLVQRVTGSFLAGVVAGILFSFSPLRWGELGHVQLLPIFWSPLALLACHRFLETRRPLPFLGMVLALVAEFYASINLGVLLMVTLLFFVGLHVLLDLRGRDRLFLVATRRGVVLTLLAVALMVCLLLPLAVPYARTLHTWQVGRSVSENASFSCEPLSLVIPPPSFASYRLVSERCTHAVRNCSGVGFVPLLLAAIGLLAFWRHPERFSPEQRRLARRLLWMAPILAICMLGPMLIWLDKNRGIPLPYTLVYHGIPGATAVRTPVRFYLPLLLCLSILAGFGVRELQHLWQRFSLLPRLLLIVAPVLLLGMDYAVSETPGWQPAARTPDVYAYLAQGEPDRPILELPARGFACQDDYEYLYYQTRHWRPLVAGVTGSATPAVLQTWARTASMPTEETLRFLELCPAQTVVLHLDRYTPAEAEAWRHASLERHGFRLAADFGADRVWERQGELPAGAPLLQVRHGEPHLTRRLLLPRLALQIDVAPNEQNLPWRCLERGCEEVEICLTDADGRDHFYQRPMEIPPYLLAGQIMRARIEPITAVPAHIRHVRLHAAHLEEYDADVDWNVE